MVLRCGVVCYVQEGTAGGSIITPRRKRAMENCKNHHFHHTGVRSAQTCPVSLSANTAIPHCTMLSSIFSFFARAPYSLPHTHLLQHSIIAPAMDTRYNRAGGSEESFVDPFLKGDKLEGYRRV